MVGDMADCIACVHSDFELQRCKAGAPLICDVLKGCRIRGLLPCVFGSSMWFEGDQHRSTMLVLVVSSTKLGCWVPVTPGQRPEWQFQMNLVVIKLMLSPVATMEVIADCGWKAVTVKQTMWWRGQKRMIPYGCVDWVHLGEHSMLARYARPLTCTCLWNSLGGELRFLDSLSLL